jgi:hypothetical protein
MSFQTMIVAGSGDLAEPNSAVGVESAERMITRPHWSRISGGFGEDADLTSRLVQAHIRGFQSEQLGPESVAWSTWMNCRG